MKKAHFRERARWRNELRCKLEREVFNQKYNCYICARKENLHIHHLLYTGDKEGFFNPKYYVILCAECHGVQTTRQRWPRRRKKLST